MQRRIINYNFSKIEYETGNKGHHLIPVRELSSGDIKDLLRRTKVTFIVAVIGSPFKWIPESKAYQFWKDELMIRLVEPDSAEQGFCIEDYPSEYCYLATEWRDSWKDDPEKSYIVLTMHH